MFTKFFNFYKLSSFSRQHKAPKDVAGTDMEEESAALRIIRPGGIVDCYYTPILAVRILEKYPSFVLTRPDVFRQPWNSVIRPDQTLIPGQKYFIVPQNTVRKLRRRIRKPSQDVAMGTSNLQPSKSIKKPSQDVAMGTSNLQPSKSKHVLTKNRPSRRRRQQQQQNKDPKQEARGASKNPSKKNGSKGKKPSTFFQIDMKHRVSSGSSMKKMRSKEAPREKRSITSSSWQPSLTSITEVCDE